MGMQTSVGRVALRGGDRVDEPSGVLVDERASRRPARGQENLYVVAVLSGPLAGREMAAAHLVQSLRQAYFEQQGSVTARLQHALRRGNELLLGENRDALPAERRTAGVTCAVVRDQDLFLGQVGPTAAFLLHQGQVTRFPDVSPWLDDIPPEEVDGAALGERREVNVALFHAPLDAGHTLLLADDRLARAVLPEDWLEVLDQDSTDAVLEALLAAGQGGDLTALVVQVGRPAAAPQAAAPARPAPPPGPPPGERATAWLQAAGRTTAGALGGLGASGLTLLKRLMPDRNPPQPARRQTTSVSYSKTGRQAPKKAQKKEAPRRQTKATEDLVQKILIAVSIAIPVVVAIVVAVTLLQRGQTHRAELEALWQQAEGYWQQSQTTTDPPVVRAHLTNAQEAVDQILELRPDHAQAVELRTKIQAQLDVINRVKRIGFVGELNTYPVDADLARIVVQGNHVFVLDRSNDTVYHHLLDEELGKALKADSLQSVLVKKGAQVGSTLVGDLVDMAWMPIGPNRQKASLVILESGGTLLDFDPTTGELLPLPVANSDAWRFAQIIGSHSGRFYVLDASANKIWRYDPTPDGYSSPPTEWLQAELDLAGVVDMAIGDSIFLLYADGTIRKLSQGQPETFDAGDWDTPPRSPTALFTRPPEETQWLYVADQGNRRIVQCGVDGRFRQQFRVAEDPGADSPDPLATARNLFVDEIVGYAYVLSGQKLYLLVLPLSE